jgi:hypothetical protein
MNRHLRCDAKGERGTALVEFTLAMVFILLPFLTGVIALSWVFNQYLELTNAVTIGAQLLAVSRGNTTTVDPCLTVEQAIYRAAPLLNPADVAFTYTFTPSNGGTGTSFTGGGVGGKNDQSGCSATSSSGANAYMQQGENVTVIATYPCDSPIGVFGSPAIGGHGRLPFACNFTAKVTQIIQ